MIITCYINTSKSSEMHKNTITNMTGVQISKGRLHITHLLINPIDSISRLTNSS